MTLPKDYDERVYAGVLGKIIGVYMGRPVEGWTYDDIARRIGEADYYVNDAVGAYYRRSLGVERTPPLVVTDDDITGTFTFLRAIKDYGFDGDISEERIGLTWLNYIVENRSVFWWGGMGNSTEHTAYLRLKNGIAAPESGSIALNGRVVAEQIGSQIFIDGWAMIAPGDPAYAADLARRAARVSHDGEAIYGAQVIAAMEAAAFVEKDMEALLDIGSSLIPGNSTIRAVIDDVRSWHAKHEDWRASFAEIRKKYGYDRFPGNVHIVPNHAVVMLSLLYGGSDFRETMRIANSAGWDTDCNAANAGCLLGIKDGLSCFDGPLDWRGPVADRMLMPSADGGGTVTDAVRTAQYIIDTGRALAGERPEGAGKTAPFTFRFPGSVQGFRPFEATTRVSNILGAREGGERCLLLSFYGTGSAATPVFILPDELDMQGYRLMASPAIYSGQTLVAEVRAQDDLDARLFVSVYSSDGSLRRLSSPARRLGSGEATTLNMAIPDTGGQPIAEIGLEASAVGPESAGSLELHSLAWDGEANARFARPLAEAGLRAQSEAWRVAWVNAVDQWDWHWREAYRLSQNAGRGLLIQGALDWHDYEAESTLTVSLARSAGIAVRVQGMRRYYALLVKDGQRASLVKYDDIETVLCESAIDFLAGRPTTFRLRAQGPALNAWIDDVHLFEYRDAHRPLAHGAAAFVLEEGHLSSESLSVRP